MKANPMPQDSLRAVIYVSHATQAFTLDDAVVLGEQARRLNALDGITGLLACNGSAFCQYVEGMPGAIDDLLERLGRDLRHRDLRITFDEPVVARAVPSWEMRVFGRDEWGGFRLSEISAGLPSRMPETLRSAILASTALVVN
jgi:hypothetical protein